MTLTVAVTETIATTTTRIIIFTVSIRAIITKK